jgi:hypothetical protein
MNIYTKLILVIVLIQTVVSPSSPVTLELVDEEVLRKCIKNIQTNIESTDLKVFNDRVMLIYNQFEKQEFTQDQAVQVDL